MLKNDPDVVESVAGSGPVGQRTQVGPVERDGSRGRHIETGQQMQERRFATPTWTCTADDLAAFDL